MVGAARVLCAMGLLPLAAVAAVASAPAASAVLAARSVGHR